MSSNDMYLRLLPFCAHDDIRRILDRDSSWEILAGRHMNLDMRQILDLSRDDERRLSPSDQLLTFWGQQNETVVNLFVVLSEMQHYEAMAVLKPYVDSRYHRLITEGEENISVVLEQGTTVPWSSHNQNCPGDKGGTAQVGSSTPGASAPAASGPGILSDNPDSEMDKNLNSDYFNVLDECDQYSGKMLPPHIVDTVGMITLSSPVPVPNETIGDKMENFTVSRALFNTASSHLQSLQFSERIESDSKEISNVMLDSKMLGGTQRMFAGNTAHEISELQFVASPSPVEDGAKAAAVATLTIEDTEPTEHEETELNEDEDRVTKDGIADTQFEYYVLTAVGKEPLPIFQ